MDKKWLLLKYRSFFISVRKEFLLMKTLDLKKNNILNFEKLEETEISNNMWEQDLIRSWKFLKMTHTLESRDILPELYLHQEYNYEYKEQEWKYYDYVPDNEAVCIRALIDHKKTKRKVGNKEHNY